MNWLKNIFNILISIILPKNEETLYLESLSISDMLEKITPARIMYKGNFFAIFDYKDPLTRKLIWQIKYKANRNICSKIAELLYNHILEEISDEILFDKYENIFILPIPCSKKRLKEKGFNQTHLLCDAVSKIDSQKVFKIDKNILIKIKDTQHQVNVKNREKRLKNLSGSFTVKKGVNLNKSCVLLIDDVITTGATMTEASRVLKSAGAKKVICVAVAH